MRECKVEAVKLVIVAAAILSIASAKAKGCVEWSGIEPHPAVVNPVCGYEPGTVVDLCGEWDFFNAKFHADRAKTPYETIRRAGRGAGRQQIKNG